MINEFLILLILMLSAIRENMNKRIESYYANDNRTIDLNTSIWKDSFVEFKKFYEIFNSDKIDLTDYKDVVKSIIFAQCCCETLSSVKLDLTNNIVIIYYLLL